MAAIKKGMIENVKILTKGQDVNDANQVTPVRVSFRGFRLSLCRVVMVRLLWIFVSYGSLVRVNVDKLRVLLCNQGITNLSTTLNCRCVVT